jgi:DNA-binding response OmpR family regulator
MGWVQGDGGQVLIVDADSDTVDGIASALEALGYEARGVGSHEEALSAVKEHETSLVIIDVELRDSSGYELLQDLRAQLGDVPVIFVSGQRTEPVDRVAGLLAGGDDYLTKPVDPDELTARVRAVLRRTAAS